MERQVQMRKVKNAGPMQGSRRFLWGILLGAVCLLSACGKREAVFVAGESSWEEAAGEATSPKSDGEAAGKALQLETAEEAAGKGAAGEALQPEAAGEAALPGTAEEAVGKQDSGKQDVSTEGTQGIQEDGQGQLVVYVCGQVQNPGVYTLSSGSRIADAVELAGGMTEEAAGDVLNLAENLTDAQMIRIPSLEEVQELGAEVILHAVGGGASSVQIPVQPGTEKGVGGADSQGKVSLNQATREQLLSLPGIGESKADAILLYRQENGGFQTVEEIMNISGIKEGVFLKIKDKIMI